MPDIDPTDPLDLRDLGLSRDRDGRLGISVSHCNWCGCVVLGLPQGPEGDCSSCGGELHPVRKTVLLGDAVQPSSLAKTS